MEKPVPGAKKLGDAALAYPSFIYAYQTGVAS